MNLEEVNKSIADSATAFKQMQITLLVFCLITTIAIVTIVIKN
jgi:hypothetical protein